MSTRIKKLCLAAIICAAFYASGYFAMFIENWHDSLLASTAVFGVSFTSLVAGGIKLLHDMFS